MINVGLLSLVLEGNAVAHYVCLGLMIKTVNILGASQKWKQKAPNTHRCNNHRQTLIINDILLLIIC